LLEISFFNLAKIPGLRLFWVLLEVLRSIHMFIGMSSICSGVSICACMWASVYVYAMIHKKLKSLFRSLEFKCMLIITI